MFRQQLRVPPQELRKRVPGRCLGQVRKSKGAYGPPQRWSRARAHARSTPGGPPPFFSPCGRSALAPMGARSPEFSGACCAEFRDPSGRKPMARMRQCRARGGSPRLSGNGRLDCGCGKVLRTTTIRRTGGGVTCHVGSSPTETSDPQAAVSHKVAARHGEKPGEVLEKKLIQTESSGKGCARRWVTGEVSQCDLGWPRCRSCTAFRWPPGAIHKSRRKTLSGCGS